MPRRLMRLLLVPLVAPLFAVANATTAGAAQSFDLTTPAGGDISPGWATASGSVSFSSKTTFRVSVSSVDDRCPGDGHGAYVYVEYEFMDGTGATGTPAVAKDTDGCDNGGSSGAYTYTFTKNVKRVRVVLRECDQHDGYIGCWFFPESGSYDYSTYKDNPYTG